VPLLWNDESVSACTFAAPTCVVPFLVGYADIAHAPVPRR